MTFAVAPPPPPPPPAEREEYLSFVTLSLNNKAIMLNDEFSYAFRLPTSLFIKNKSYDKRLKILKDTIYDACALYKVDSVNDDNVTRHAEELLGELDERERVAKAEKKKKKQKEQEEQEELEEQQQQQQKQPEPEKKIELTPELTKEISWQEVSAILSTSIKKDENPKLIDFCGKLLAQTHDDQLNIGFQAESSTGKSYIPLDLATYFPASEIQKFASASPTAFYHSGVWDAERKVLIVDLRHKNLIFLDMPHFQLLERLRPLLSHDDHELTYKITDKSQKYGLKAKEVIILGPPSVFFCTAKVNPDDQEKTRLILLSPSTEEDKLKESLELLTLKKSNRAEFNRRIMKDPQRVWLMERIMCVRQGGIRDVIVPNEGKAVFDRFMNEHTHLQPRHQRDFPRIFSFIKAHALLNCFNRTKLSEDTIEANEKDIDAGFALYKGIEQSNEMGLSPYLLKIYDDAFLPILNPNQGASREDILKQYYKARHKPMSPEVLRLEIIPQLESVSLIYQEEGERRKMLVYPTVSHTYNKDRFPSSPPPPDADAVCGSNGGVKHFWETFELLQNQKQTKGSEGTVSETILKQELVSGGKLTAGEAAQIIKDMKASGELENPEYDVLCKRANKE